MTTYQIIDLIIGTISAMAMFGAVVVALWQTKYANRKRMKCVFAENIVAVNPVTNESEDFVGLTISNIGNKIFMLSSWGIKTKTGVILFLPDQGMRTNATSVERMMSIKTPYTLETEHSVTFSYKKLLFQDQLQNAFKTCQLNPNRKIKFFVVDSMGKKYYIKSKKKAYNYVNEL